MTSNALQKYASAGIHDVLSCLGIPAATATQIYQDILAKRSEEALEILFSEVRQGNFSGLDQNDVVSIIARFQRDAMEGIAKNNLRLMARLIKGMAGKQELTAPSFSRYANILASLTHKEMRILAVLVRFDRNTRQPAFPLHHQEQQTFNKHFAERHYALLEVTQQAEGHLQALMRTGLVNMHITQAGQPTQKYEITKLMDEILEYTKNFSDFGDIDD
jgi:hypothetical protein